MRPKVAAMAAAVLLILCAAVGTASAEATLSASPSTPVSGGQISFDVGTTLEGLEAVISTTGLQYVSNTGLGNQNHVITVPGVGSVYTYTVIAQPGETVSFVLSDVMEADENGEEREGQRAVWMAAAVAPQPTQNPTGDPTGQPTGEPSSEPTPSESPTASPSAEPSPSESASATASAEPSPGPSEEPTVSGNPSPTIGPSASSSAGQNGTINSGGGSIGGSGTITDSGSSSGGSSSGGSGMPRTGDIGHFWTLLGIIGGLIVVVIIAGKRVFAEED